ncbi:MAG: glycoside hydrolase family 31 protein [Calditrichae bacterium]|nr:glycoside hydrolase family 31 protein [Calditrichia bacterium]
MPSSDTINILNQTLDISRDFYTVENEYFMSGDLSGYDPQTGAGKLQWRRHCYFPDWAFTKIGYKFKKMDGKELPQEDYEIDPLFDFNLSFVTPRTIRLRFTSAKFLQKKEPSLILDGKVPADNSWKISAKKNQIEYKSSGATIRLNEKPWSLQVCDANGKVLTQTHTMDSNKGLHLKTLPFLFMRRISDYSRSFTASFSLAYDEKIFGCGESFTRLNKRGQKIPLYMTDVQSAATNEMYKPVPFFMSSRGYGMFVHTTTPCTFDFGHGYDGASNLFIGDDYLDLFIFIGSPKEILYEYTNLTGRSPVPPLWSFGLWMSRLSYKSQDEVLKVADKFYEHKIPCDVLHIDAGWFDHGWRCDYKFSKKQFPDPENMMAELKKKGIRTSLWQLPYFTPANPIFKEVFEKNLYVRDGKGNVPTDDIILDFSNPATQEWYRKKIAALFDQGASVIKADFGECAPLNGIYSSGKNGFFEHNIYPLRYTSILSKITTDKAGYSLIWARSAWAGSQRYPVHWAGDPEVTDYSMAATLRAGLSLGLSGFSFWSHDTGGFSGEPQEELYGRWLFFGMLTSHSRCHGFPPREPWLFSEKFLHDFRAMTVLKYSLMPYIYTQAKLSSEAGLPMLRALFLEYPQDPACWFIEDQYLFGSDLLVAPIFEKDAISRKVYLPPGIWTDYQTTEKYNGSQWLDLKSRKLPGILLVREDAAIPHIKVEQSTAFMDWDKIEWHVYAEKNTHRRNEVLFTPLQNKLIKVGLQKTGEEWRQIK